MPALANVIIELRDCGLDDLRRFIGGDSSGPGPVVKHAPATVAAPPVQIVSPIVPPLPPKAAEIIRVPGDPPPIVVPKYDGDIPRDTNVVNLLQYAPQELPELAGFLARLSDEQLDTVWVAAILDALRESLPAPSIAGLAACLNYVRQRFRGTVKVDTSEPAEVKPGSSEIEPQRAPQVKRAELLQMMLDAVPNVGDKALSSHFPQGLRQRLQAIALSDHRLLYHKGSKPGPGESFKPGVLERVA